MVKLSESEILAALNAVAAADEETAEIYRREARALLKTDREATAALLLDAAYANDRDEAPVEDIVRDLNIAVSLADRAPWVYEAAHRLMLKLGLWREALALMEKEYALVQAPDYAVAIGLTSADLQWIVADEPAEAFEWVKRVLEREITNVDALYDGLWMSLAAPQSEERGTVQSEVEETAGGRYAESLAKILGAPAERAVLYALAGSIQAAQHNDIQALECYGLAVQSDRTNPYAQLRFALLNEKFGRLQDAAQAYAQAAQIFKDPGLCGAFYRRAGTIYGYIGQSERSSYYLSESLKFIDDKFSVIWMAIDAFRRTGNHQRVVELERQIIELAADDETKAAHYMSMADAYLHEIGATDEAIDALEAAGKLGGYSADDRLAALYESRGDWKNLARVLERMIHNHPMESQALQWLMADALWQNGDKDNAIEIMSELQGGLGRFKLDLAYEETANHEAHARLLDNWIRECSDEGMRSALLSQLLTILQERLHAPEIAIQYFKDFPPVKSTRDLLWRKIHLCASLGQFENVVEGYVQIAGELQDKVEARLMRLDAALMYDRVLKDPDKAIELLRMVHETTPNDVASMVLFHAIALREKRYELVLQANSWRESFQMNSVTRAEIACENAWACLMMTDDNGALAWFEKARKYAPLSPYSMKLYIHLLRRMSRWEDIVRVIDAALPKTEVIEEPQPEPVEEKKTGISDQIQEIIDLADMAMDDALGKDTPEDDDEIDAPDGMPGIVLSAEQKSWHDMMLDVQSHCLKHPAGTVYARQQYFERNPSIQTFVEYLVEKLTVDPLDMVLSAIVDCRSRLGTCSDEMLALMDWVQAEVLRKQCPSGAPAKTAATIEALLRRSLSLPYGPCLRAEILRCLREVPHEDVSAWLERYAVLTPDRWMGLALSREAALRAIWVEEDYESARRAISRGLIKEDSDRRTLWMLEQFSAISEDWQALGFFREKLAQQEVMSRARLQVLKSALAPYIDDDLTEHAVRVAQECLKLDAHVFPALVTLAHIAEDSEDNYSLASIADRLSEASVCSENRTSYGLWAAQLWHKSLSRPEMAIASLNRLLAQNPACMPAIEMSEKLHLEQQKFDLLSKIYVRAITALPEGEQQTDLLRKLAHLQTEKLKDAPAASLTLSRILKLHPDDIEALSMQSELLISQQRWSEAVDVLEQLSKVAESSESRHSTNLKLADILIHQIEQPDRARRILRRHLVQFEHDMPALQLLFDIARTERNWNDAKSVLEEICEAEGTQEARKAQLAFTRIGREAGWSHDVRTLYERQAIAAVLDYREDFDALVEDYKSHGELNRLIEVAQRELSKQGLVEMIAKYRGCVAALLVANQQHREALAFLSDIIQDSQHTDWAYLARAQALTSAGQLASAVGEYRRTLTRNIRLNDAFVPFAEVLKQTGDEITLASVTALRDLRKDGVLPEVQDNSWKRCIKGSPRGFFDVELMALKRNYLDALRYLRMMTPYAYSMFNDGMDIQSLDISHWAPARCHRLFGQNFELKHAFVAKNMKKARCRICLNEENSLIFDESLMDEDNDIAFDFWASYAMHQAVTGGALIEMLDDEHVEALFCALCQLHPETTLAQTIKKQLFKALPRADRKLFKDGVPFLSPNWHDFRAAMQTRAACVGAIISACPAYALYAHPDDPELETFLISESYVRFVQMYWS